ncbi:MAG: hypothetical protein HY038_11000 [Nitrospirae bacterium]|nr:hypothetical protein [Nitrospirota bacterium]
MARGARRRAVGTVMAAVIALSTHPASWADELPFTKNLPIPEFQNRAQDAKPYDFDAPPEGMFRSITMAEDFEEQLGFQRTHEIVPVKPTERFTADVPAIFIVFSLHQHYQSFKVFGRCTPEAVSDIPPGTIVSEDAMHIALEDDSGYLRLSPPKGGWKLGRYKVEIHAGEQVNEMSLMGTMRFTVVASQVKK